MPRIFFRVVLLSILCCLCVDAYGAPRTARQQGLCEVVPSGADEFVAQFNPGIIELSQLCKARSAAENPSALTNGTRRAIRAMANLLVRGANLDDDRVLERELRSVLPPGAAALC